MYYVYVIKSFKNGSYYKGLTNDLERRLREHDQGRNYSTKLGKPWKLIFAQITEDRKSARNLEKFLKSGYGRELIKELEGY